MTPQRPPIRHKHSIRDLAQAAIDLTATEIVKGIGVVVSVAIPIVLSIVTGVWYLSAEVTRTQARIDDATKAVAEIAAKMDRRDTDGFALRERMTHLEDSVAWCCGQKGKKAPDTGSVAPGSIGLTNSNREVSHAF